MKIRKGIKIFALIEIGIGGLTLFSTILSLVLHTSAKPVNVLIFVILASIISLCIGIGLLFKSSLALQMLLYFAFSIILTKVLIFAKILYLTGALETSIPEPVKNSVSTIYHLLILFYFHQKQIRAEFKKT